MNRPGAFAQDNQYMEEEGERSISDQVDVQHYLRILRKHKWLITLFTAVITAFAAYYAYTATPIYRATSTLLIEQQKANIVSIEELYGVDTENTDYYQTEFELLKSRALAQKVVDRLDLWDHPELSATMKSSEISAGLPEEAPETNAVSGMADKVSGMFGSLASMGGDEEASTRAASSAAEADAIDDAAADTAASSTSLLPGDAVPLSRSQEAVVSNFMGRLSVEPVRKTKLVKISFESADPAFAARVANSVGEQYIESYLDAKLELTTTASQWLAQRLGELKIDLDAATRRLIEFRQDNGLVELAGGVGRLTEQELLLLTTELTSARSEQANLQNINNDIEAALGRPELLGSIPAVQLDPLVQGTRIEQGAVQRNLDELLNRYGERHPRVLDAKAELASLDDQLAGHVQRVSAKVSQDLQLARQRVAEIQRGLTSGKDEIQALGSSTFELDALKREVDTKQNVYDQFFSRMTEAKSADGLETANARISDYARVPGGPFKPKKQLIIALAALAALVMATLMAFLYETTDDTIKSTRDVEGKLGLTLLGILPLIKKGLLQGKKELPLNPAETAGKQSRFPESMNTVRTALCVGDSKAYQKVIMVTSSVPGEGKSTTAINLAYSLGQLERVLLIDCDLRRPTIAKAAGQGKDINGLSSLLTNMATARQCIRRGEFGGVVDILPSGPISDQPLELLSSKRFEKVLEQLKQHYDRIVIDSAPTQAVSDALVLGRLTDSVVYAVKSHDTSMDLVKRGVSRLQQSGAHLAGVVITQVDIDRITSYGGDYYYQGYYDYYDYREKGPVVEGVTSGRIRLTQQELMAMRSDESDVDLNLTYDLDDARHPQAFDGQASVAPSTRGSSDRPRTGRRKSVESDLDIL